MLYLIKSKFMINFSKKLKNILKFWLLFILVFPFFMWWVSFGVNDLLRQIMEPAIYTDNIIDMWGNVNSVWKNVFEWSLEVGLDVESGSVDVYSQRKPSIIVKITRLLLILVITLSVTMILYNWMTYIIQTWQWKESKDLIKNIIYIVVWIIISLFSVIIITIIQSVPKTIDEEVRKDIDNRTDNESLEWDKTYLRDILNNI